MFYVTRYWYKYGREGDPVETTSKEYETIEKALAYAQRYATGLRFVSVEIYNDDYDVIYEYFADGSIGIDRLKEYFKEDSENEKDKRSNKKSQEKINKETEKRKEMLELVRALDEQYEAKKEMIATEIEEKIAEQRSEEFKAADKTELCRQLKEGTFYFYKFGLLVKLPVASVIDKEDFITLDFANNAGYVDFFIEHMRKVRRPGNIICKFSWCYSLKNDYEEHIGYIGKEEDREEKLYKAMDKAIDEAMQEEI